MDSNKRFDTYVIFFSPQVRRLFEGGAYSKIGFNEEKNVVC